MTEKSKVTEELIKAQEEYIDTVFGEIQCESCRHLISGNTCKAFDAIPLAIIAGDHHHRTPYPGDKGICYEPKGR